MVRLDANAGKVGRRKSLSFFSLIFVGAVWNYRQSAISKTPNVLPTFMDVNAGTVSLIRAEDDESLPLMVAQKGYEELQPTDLERMMRLAAALGFSVATTEMGDIDEPVLIVERYDRRGPSDGSLQRLHQADGGPGFADAARLIRRISRGACRTALRCGDRRNGIIVVL